MCAMARRNNNPVTQAASESPAQAEAILRKHLRSRPKDQAALEALADVLALQGRLSEIATALIDAAKSPRASAAVIGYSCDVANAAGAPLGALRLAKHGTSLHPDSIPLWRHRGKAEMATADAPSAAASFERAHALAPDDTDILALLSDADLSRGAFPVPDKYAKMLLELEPDNAVHHVRLGTAHRFNDRLDDAEACFRRAIELDANLQTAYAGLSETLESKGDSESAAAQLAPLIAGGKPSFTVVSAWARVQQQLGDLPGAIGVMEQYLASGRGTLTHKSNVLMRLGRAYEKSGRYSDAFRCWTQGNKAHNGRWDPDARQVFVDRMINTLSKKQLPSLPRAAAAPFTPILVVGMYRSGTTLTEQILSSHPMIAPVGESPALPHAIKALAEAAGPMERFPGTLADVTPEMVAMARDIYVDEVRAQVGESPLIVDKLPMNYLNVGIASLLLPNARVLHLMRDPMDTAVSCFSQSFASRMAFTADLEHLGRAIVQERRIMSHWHEVCDLPMLDVQYELLVSNPKEVLGDVFEFLGIPWDDAVLRFHESKRVAATPSMDQVRKPINTSAIGRAKRFGELLDPLRRALGDVV